MEREEPESIFPRINLFQAPEAVVNVARFVLNRIYDIPAVPQEEKEE